jgi:beta-glucosidase
MPQATYHFPKPFLWGTATASYQVEGNNTNSQWWKWEQDGHTNGRSGLACDWWGGRWREDFNRAAETGQNAHRLSVEWSRIQPTPDRWDEEALEKYRAMLRGLKERGITVMVTLHHFSNPLWLEKMQGWETEAVVPLFEKFVRKTVETLKEYCSLWCTINEPNVYYSLAYVTGEFPPGKKDIRAALRVAANLSRAHAAAYRAIHAIQPEAQVGYALHYRPMKSANSWNPLHNLVTGIQNAAVNEVFPSAIRDGIMRTPLGKIRIPEAKGTQDYVGLNYYSEDTVAFDITQPGLLFGRRHYPVGTETNVRGDFGNTPEGFFKAIKWATRFNVPVYITENGIDDSDDSLRRRYLAQHIHQMWRAVNFNWPVRGYFHWTLVDNFEWDRGWTQRFGLWELDPESQKRTKRPSADLYAAICKENGLSSEMVEKWCPEVMGKLFPE